MKCLICAGFETVDKLTSVTLERGEFRLIINQVPARECPNCGEAYVGEDVACRLISKAEDLVGQGVREGVGEY
jgi:YgiT-type zinc finger domain-containing protein